MAAPLDGGQAAAHLCKIGAWKHTEVWIEAPGNGPLQLKNTFGRTPVLDIGALKKIRSGDIKVVPGIKKFLSGKVELINGEIIDIDALILATGYKSNVPFSFLGPCLWYSLFCCFQECDFFARDGFSRQPFPKGWKGKSGLYAVGFTRPGLSGVSMDAMKIAEDIGEIWKEETKQAKQFVASNRRRISQM
ncbi:putative indole-3-pyruvate monooxygenase [Nymphaea thermarum]|nr:putative indole-3-pyruvate monooxygenase [Nymphaea thermarum]